MEEPKHPALRAVYWREETLEVALWLRGEGYEDLLDADLLSRFLGIERDKSAAQLELLVTQGYLRQSAHGRYELTAEGEEEGQRIIGWSRAVPPPTAGSCGPGCWCATSPVEAAICAVD